MKLSAIQGTVDHPMRRGDLCVVRGCPSTAARLRVTATGMVVSYCEPHLTQARRVFDVAKEDAWHSPTPTR